MDPILIINMVLAGVWQFLAWTWWFWAFCILAPLTTSTWLYWRQEVFKQDMQWILFELRIPREIKKSPRAMEQVLAAIHALRNTANNLRETWWDGEVTRWFSMEMVSFGGEVHFYFRFYKKYRPLVETAFLSYYPDVELVEVDDYVSRFPENLQEMYKQGYQTWGTEMILVREDMYPIRTYADFEAVAEEKEFDPIATFIEVLAHCKPEEMVGIQILISATGTEEWHDHWDHKLQELIRDLQSPNRGKDGGHAGVGTKVDFPGGILPVFETEDHKESEFSVLRTRRMSPGEQDVLKAIEKNLSKPAFETVIRFLYFSPQALYYDSFPRRGISGAFNQFGALDMNSFKRNDKVGTKVEFWESPFFSKIRKEMRGQRLIYNYKRRKMPLHTFMGKLITSHLFNWNFYSKHFEMNTECLATLFHPPTFMVLTGPHVKRVESRKVGPPAGLAIFGDEEDIEKYKE